MSQNHTERPLTDEEVEAVVELVKEGETAQFRRLVLHYQRRLHVYCHHMLGDRTEAEDAVQEIFLKCYRGVHAYAPTVSFSAWLYRIAYRHCLNVIRQRSARRRLFEWLKRMPGASPKTDGSNLLHRLLEPLTAEERHLVLLRAVEQRSYREIADIMNKRPELLRKKYERLRRKMAERHASRTKREEKRNERNWSTTRS